MGAQSLARFTGGAHSDAVPTFLETLEGRPRTPPPAQQATAQGVRAPAGKTWETFEHDRMPMALRQQLDQLAQESFVDRGVNILVFGLPGTGVPGRIPSKACGVTCCCGCKRTPTPTPRTR